MALALEKHRTIEHHENWNQGQKTLAYLVECPHECGRLWVHNPDRVISKTLKMVVVAACLTLSTK